MTSGYGPLLSPAIAAQVGRAAAPHWRAAGLVPHPRGGLYEHLYFDPCPPALQLAAIHDVPAVPVRVTPLPAAHRASTDPATVYVTFGTLWNRDPDAFRVILAALSVHPVDVVVTLGVDGDPAALGAQPDNVHVHRFIPQAELLPRCDAVIAHGGAGTTLGALAHGLPLLLLPQGADQHYNAERVAAAGAGLSLAPPQATSAAVSRAIDTLLGDARLRAGAQRVATEIAAMPGPEAGVAHLEALTRRPAAE